MIRGVTELHGSREGIVMYLFALVTCVTPVPRMRNVMSPCPHEATLWGVRRYKTYQPPNKK